MFFTDHVKPSWNDFVEQAEDESTTFEQLKDAFPFSAFMTVRLQNEDDDALVNLFDCNESKSELLVKAKEYWAVIETIFD